MRLCLLHPRSVLNNSVSSTVHCFFVQVTSCNRCDRTRCAGSGSGQAGKHAVAAYTVHKRIFLFILIRKKVKHDRHCMHFAATSITVYNQLADKSFGSRSLRHETSAFFHSDQPCHLLTSTSLLQPRERNGK